MDNVKKLAEIVEKSNYIVFFGGAGTSTDSGIKDFRGKNGLYKTLYKGYRPEEILSIDFFIDKRQIFSEYVKEKMSIENIKPNKGHYALVELEKMGKLKAVITQNIDNLHQEAGSKKVLELHGTLKEWYCLNCGIRDDKEFKCKCGGVVRPKVTLYGEMLDEEVTYKAIEEIKRADTLIISGTSLTVYPAANYITYFKGKNLIIINEDSTGYDSRATLSIKGNFSEILDKLIKEIKRTL
ncbi:MAG: NAD-dependent protein deacylase [Fusobacterium sp. JB021]|nr:NAD-dependent protein deacylase [Fusobacterium sp. JB020]MDP0494234.1 NAD-dependent protein deacylase [Fusobacterium sp. JB021]MDP0505719.1 NAD-dependent protein deacylase [Fusobacterium sp. JB019]